MIPIRASVVLAAVLALATGCGGSSPSPGDSASAKGIDEPSGVLRVDGRLVIVGDDDPEFCLLSPAAPDERGLVALSPGQIERVRLGDSGATDLEGLAVLADGRLVALSEDDRALHDAEGLVARWDASLREWGQRGLEAVTVLAEPDGGSLVAVAWEGGYPDCRGVPAGECGKARRPRVVVHRIPADARGLELTAATAVVDTELHVPLLPGEEPCAQRFRVPGLLWIRLPNGEDGFLALMSSMPGAPAPAGSECECPKTEHGKPRRYCHKWLLRFDRSGAPVGEPFDLDEVFPAEIATANWEGLGWWQEGRSLALCYDEKWDDRRIDPQCVLVIDLPAGWGVPEPPAP